MCIVQYVCTYLPVQVKYIPYICKAPGYDYYYYYYFYWYVVVH